ncbi:hypothetical protein [Citreimonas salinaria]|uniref:Uncharacterized protein n=1 Tax=Citreimonas salinaria TaxID=321339 RepID=A0A1H3LZK8_9RHOB|nr:hypothetical protein [Citreimonas salinaria]SDY69881.1 hypothetical protein SAMN05444340_11522 [Citreimonas salinaria]
MRIYSAIHVDKRFRRPVKTEMQHGILVAAAAACAAHRFHLSEAAFDDEIDALCDLLEQDRTTDFLSFLVEILADLNLATNSDREDLRTCLRVMSEDLDAINLATTVLKSPRAGESAARLRELCQHSPEQPGEALEAYAERMLRLHLRAGLPAVLQAILGIVGRLSVSLHPGNRRKQATIVAQFVGNAQAAATPRRSR